MSKTVTVGLEFPTAETLRSTWNDILKKATAEHGGKLDTDEVSAGCGFCSSADWASGTPAFGEVINYIMQNGNPAMEAKVLAVFLLGLETGKKLGRGQMLAEASTPNAN